jgi:hypothetical protein
MAGVVDRVETAGRIEGFVFEKREEIVGLALQPAAVVGVFTPGTRFIGRSGHFLE